MHRPFYSKILISFTLLVSAFLFSAQPVLAQADQPAPSIQPLRSDVGINGLTANFHWLSNFTYLKSDSLLMAADSLQSDGSSELEFVFHDVRMLTPRLGAGFKVLTSFFVNDAKGQPGFGVGSWGVGPLLRAYPFKTNRLQPYLQASAMFGNNMAVGTFANTKNGGHGFRVRLGLRGGLSYRITNGFGLFVAGGPDWESSRIFKADARTWQLNFGVDVFRFN